MSKPVRVLLISAPALALLALVLLAFLGSRPTPSLEVSLTQEQQAQLADAARLGNGETLYALDTRCPACADDAQKGVENVRLLHIDNHEGSTESNLLSYCAYRLQPAQFAEHYPLAYTEAGRKDLARFPGMTECAKDPVVAQRLRAEHELAVALGVTATPTYLTLR